MSKSTDIKQKFIKTITDFADGLSPGQQEKSMKFLDSIPNDEKELDDFVRRVKDYIDRETGLTKKPSRIGA
ncbi:MAG: hypothetical protein HPY71_13135 [Firmicutes bacterium]|nr:hypothetical protein [Bacillota bacterium]